MVNTNIGLHDASIIVLFGPTGAGKTTFANVASGDSMRVGKGLKSCTKDVTPTTMFIVDGKPVVMVDCPGFDDTHLSETDILKTLTGFLTTAYKQDFKITGLLYLHKITDTRVGGASLRHMNMFKELCGTDSLKNVVYVTNMWSDPPKEAELHRETELRDYDEFFGMPLADGARMARHNNTQKSAHDIVRMLLPRPPTVPKIAKEIVDEGRKLEETSAGAALGHGLEDELRKLNDEIKQLRQEHAKAIENNNIRFEQALEAQEREAREKHQKLQQEIESLKQGHKQDEVAWGRRISDYSAAVDNSMAKAFADMLGHFGSNHEYRLESMRQKYEADLIAAREAEEKRTAVLKKTYDEALEEARQHQCIIA